MEMKQLLETDDPETSVTVLVIQPEEFDEIYWIKDHEFIYQDKLYDIFEKESGDQGEIIFYCIEDHKEKDLLTHLGRHIERQHENGPYQQKNGKPVVKNPIKDLFSPEFHECLTAQSGTIEFKSYLNTYSSVYIDPISPPPKSL